MPSKNMFKIGIATAAAAVGAILAISSVFAHATPTTNGRSMVGTIVNAAMGASFVSNEEPAPTALTAEQDQDAIEAAELAAEQQQEAAELAARQAKLAAEQAAEAAEQAAEQQDEDANENETEQADTDQESSTTTVHHDTSGDHEGGD